MKVYFQIKIYSNVGEKVEKFLHTEHVNLYQVYLKVVVPKKRKIQVRENKTDERQQQH